MLTLLSANAILQVEDCKAIPMYQFRKISWLAFTRGFGFACLVSVSETSKFSLVIAVGEDRACFT